MAKATSTESRRPTTRGGYVIDATRYRLAAWFPLAWKFAVAFGVWLLGAYAANTFTTSEAGAELSAIAFWFGILFASVLVLFGVAMAVLGFVGDVRNPIIRES